MFAYSKRCTWPSTLGSQEVATEEQLGPGTTLEGERSPKLDNDKAIKINDKPGNKTKHNKPLAEHSLELS